MIIYLPVDSSQASTAVAMPPARNRLVRPRSIGKQFDPCITLLAIKPGDRCICLFNTPLVPRGLVATYGQGAHADAELRRRAQISSTCLSSEPPAGLPRLPISTRAASSIRLWGRLRDGVRGGGQGAPHRCAAAPDTAGVTVSAQNPHSTAHRKKRQHNCLEFRRGDGVPPNGVSLPK